MINFKLCKFHLGACCRSFLNSDDVVYVKIRTFKFIERM